MKNRKTERGKLPGWKKTLGQKNLTSKKNVASTSSTGVEIRKFNGKNFALCKEMMEDILIIRRQIKAIRHNNKPSAMASDEWRSLDGITRSPIRMHLPENVYFNMAKETTTFALWETLHAVYEKQCRGSCGSCSEIAGTKVKGSWRNFYKDCATMSHWLRIGGIRDKNNVHVC